MPADAEGTLTLILAFSPDGGATDGGPISQEPRSRGQPSGRSESFVYCALIVNLPFLYNHTTNLCEQYACWLHGCMTRRQPEDELRLLDE